MEFSALALSTLSGLASVQLSSDLALFKQLLVLSTAKVILDGCVVSTAATTLVTATLHRARTLVSRLRDQGDVVGGGALELAPVKLIVCSNLCNTYVVGNARALEWDYHCLSKMPPFRFLHYSSDLNAWTCLKKILKGRVRSLFF